MPDARRVVSGERPGNTSGKTAQPGGDINIVQVLAPGGYIHISLGNSPFTLGAGATIAPLLRYYSDNAAKSPYSMLRISGFLAVDLTLLPIVVGH